jgi:TetR/AcrR family transcriptional regulator
MVKAMEDPSAEFRILKAAKKVFLAKGMSGARMQDIADEAGINKAMLHYYFRSKEKLFETIFKEIAKNFIPGITAIFEAEKPLFEKIELFCCEYIDKIREMPYMPLFVLHEINRQPSAFIKKMWGNRKPPVRIFFEQVESEIEKGKIKAIPPVQLLMNIISLCIFPFIAMPMIEHVADISRDQFNLLMNERKILVPRLIIDAIKIE